MKKYILYLLILLILIFTVVSCDTNEETLVIYVSVDQIFAEPILDAFEREYGIRVLPVFDVEATKTTGMVNRLIAEEGAPKADVFWSGEAAQTELLKRRGTVEDYVSFGGRARILLVNTDMVAETDFPDSVESLLDGRYGSVAIANPVFGTTSTHAAALYHVWGAERGRAFFTGLQESGVQILDGNSVVRDKVASGEIAVGLTDTDDAHLSIVQGRPVKIIYPDQSDGGLGVFIIPNTVAIVSGAQNRTNAELFISYVTSEEVQASLAEMGWFMPPEEQSGLKVMEIDFVELDRIIEQVRTEMTEMFIR